MAKSDRRAKRVASDLVIELLLREGLEGPATAGPIPAFLGNISPHGAGLIVSQNQWDESMFSTLARDYPRHLLFLTLEQPPLPSLALPAKLVWFKLEAQEDSAYYQLGVEFLPQPQEETVRQFFAQSCPGRTSKPGFWSRLFGATPR